MAIRGAVLRTVLNLHGLFLHKRTPQPRFRVKHRCANRVFAKGPLSPRKTGAPLTAPGRSTNADIKERGLMNVGFAGGEFSGWGNFQSAKWGTGGL